MTNTVTARQTETPPQYSPCCGAQGCPFCPWRSHAALSQSTDTLEEQAPRPEAMCPVLSAMGLQVPGDPRLPLHLWLRRRPGGPPAVDRGSNGRSLATCFSAADQGPQSGQGDHRTRTKPGEKGQTHGHGKSSVGQEGGP